MKRRALCLLLVAMLLPVVTAAAAPHAISVSQFVEHPALDAVLNGFKDFFRDSSVEAVFTVHVAQGNMGTSVQIASQMVGEQPELILAIATPSAQHAAQKIRDIPIVFAAVTDPVSAGLVKTLEAPGGNVTGMTDMSPVRRQLELIRQFQPDAQSVGVIYNAGEANSVVLANLLTEHAKGLGLRMVEATVVNSGGVYQAAKSLVGRCEAVYIPTDNTVMSAFESVVKVCEENRLPLYAADTEAVPRGAVAALAIDYYRMGRQAGRMAKRILEGGGHPRDMAVERLADLMLYVNKKAAAAMGVEIPNEAMRQAGKVFE